MSQMAGYFVAVWRSEPGPGDPKVGVRPKIMIKRGDVLAKS